MGMTMRMFPEREAQLWMRETSHGQVLRLFKEKRVEHQHPLLCLPTVGAMRHSCCCSYGCYCVETLHYPDELYSHSMTQNKPSVLRLLFKRCFFRTMIKKTSNTSGCNFSRNFTPRTLTTKWHLKTREAWGGGRGGGFVRSHLAFQPRLSLYKQTHASFILSDSQLPVGCVS